MIEQEFHQLSMTMISGLSCPEYLLKV